MIKNYFKTTFRHLWWNRLYTTLNVLGLAIGISACLTVFEIVDYEFSFDKQQPNKERIYRVFSRFLYEGEEGGNAGVPEPLPNAIKKQLTGIEAVVPISDQNYASVSVPGESGRQPKVFDELKDLKNTVSAYFEMVPYKWLAGNQKTALNAPNKVVLTQSRAAKYFPGLKADEVLGSTIFYNDTLAITVSGVVADLGYPNSFQGKEFFARVAGNSNPDSWATLNSKNALYLLLNENASVGKVIEEINKISKAHTSDILKKYNIKHWHELLPLSEVHFSTQYGENMRKADKKVLYGLVGIALFLMLLAAINYVNLSTAQVPQRAKEIGIRKTLGSSAKTLIRQFLGETLLVTLLAVLLSYFLSSLSVLVFKDFIPDDIQQFNRIWRVTGFMGLLVLFVTLLSGWYPAWLITRVQAINIMKGHNNAKIGKGRFALRKGLIVFQFVVAQVFIVCTLIVGQQLHYALNKDLGFDKEAILTFSVPWEIGNEPEFKDKQFVLLGELRKHSGIAAVALGDQPMSNSYLSDIKYVQNDTGKIQSDIYFKYVDTAMLSLYDIELLAGRNLQVSDTVREYVINEMALKAYGFSSPQEALGKYLESEYNGSFPIVGVVKDFHIAAFSEKIQPVAFMMDKNRLRTFNLKLSSTNPDKWQQTIKKIETEWDNFYPEGTFNYKFYDETLASLYEQERSTSKLIRFATGITILISCLGLFGLAAYTAQRKQKEIGVRKVLGASVGSVVALLSKDFIKLVFIAIVIATPIAWYAMNNWLQDFAYRIDMEWWMFALAGLLAIVIALLTVSFQSVKAALANPVKSLRSE